MCNHVTAHYTYRSPTELPRARSLANERQQHREAYRRQPHVHLEETTQLPPETPTDLHVPPTTTSMDHLQSVVRPYLTGAFTPTLEVLGEVAMSTHCGDVGGCISRVADHWAEAFGASSRAASVAKDGVKLKLLRPKGTVMTAEGTFPQPPPRDQKSALILRHTILRMERQGVCKPMTAAEALHHPQPPLYHRVWLRAKKADGDGDPAKAIQAQDWNRLWKILKAWRMIISLNLGVNKYGLAQKFAGRTVRHAIRMLRTGDLLVYVDIEDAYYNVPLHELFSRLCAFWLDGPALRRRAPWG